MSTVTDRVWRVALNLVAEPGDARIARTVADYGPEQAMRFWCAISSTPSIQRVPQAYAVQAQHAIDTAAQDGIRVLIPGDDEWPAQLSDMDTRLAAGHDTGAAPLCLWVAGKPDLSRLVARAVAIVGSRVCTPYGKHTASQLAFGLAQHGWTVASAGDFGINDTAHRGAMLADGGVTIAVVAGGLDQPHPLSQQALFERITNTGGLLASPWQPAAGPKRARFVYRARLLAALTAGTVIVEAERDSGCLDTTHAAHELSRVVMAVPGPVGSGTSAGVHVLARDLPRVRIVTDAADVNADLTTS